MFDMQKTERLAIRLDPELREQLRLRAVAEDRPEGAMARRLIAESLRQDERQEVSR
jgi:predicted transcriptional regulator